MGKSTKEKFPSHFSAKARKIWEHVHREFELEPDAVELLRIGLENMDLGDAERAKVREEGAVVNGKKSQRLDAIKLFDGLYLRCFRQLGLDIAQPGTPAGKRV